MFFIFLVYVAAITLESLGSYISVIGLAAKTGPILIFLAITLDFSKIVIASVLYKRWKDLHISLRFILVPVLVFLVTVTSTGAYAYLIQEFGKTTASSEQQQAQIIILQKEKEKLETRKQAIDTQISQLPPESVTQRRRLTELFSKESDYINERLMVLNRELPEAQIKSMQDVGNSGTLGSIAKAWNITTEQVSRIIAFFIVLVIDPLAIVLLTVANFLVEQRKKEIQESNKKLSINTKWDRFRNALFKNKNKTSLLNQDGLKPYTDSNGQLFKHQTNLPIENFIYKAELVSPKPKALIFNKIKLSLSNIFSDFKQPEPILVKTVAHLTPKRSIKQITSFEPIVEKILHKNADTIISPSDLLQQQSLPKEIIKKMVRLDSQNIISTLIIQEPVHPILTHQSNDSLSVNDIIEPSLPVIEQESGVSPLDESIAPIIDNNIAETETITIPVEVPVKKVISKPTPRSLLSAPVSSEQNEFFNHEDYPRYNQSLQDNFPLDYDYAEDSLYWNSDDQYFDADLGRISNFDVEGFDLKSKFT